MEIIFQLLLNLCITKRGAIGLVLFILSLGLCAAQWYESLLGLSLILALWIICIYLIITGIIKVVKEGK